MSKLCMSLALLVLLSPHSYAQDNDPETGRVADPPGELRIIPSTYSKRLVVSEGKKLSFELDILSEDFPDGPFFMYGMGMPPGMTVRDNPDRSDAAFVVEYEPAYDMIDLNDLATTCEYYGSKLCYQRFDGVQFVAVGPDGRNIKYNNVSIQVVDVRLPIFFGELPEVIDSSGGILTLTATDRNLDVPQV